jgi:hypothetical protein
MAARTAGVAALDGRGLAFLIEPPGVRVLAARLR